MIARVSVKLRRATRRRAGGQCEYCLVHEDDSYVSYQIDHILSRKHGGPTTLDNLAYACALCNRRKGSDIAARDLQTGKIVPLFHPRKHQWQDHFLLQKVFIQPVSPEGRATASLLRLNASERLLERAELLRAGRYGLP
jgi:5-methylcytosine-specific restriction endonuclease McrA